MATAGRTESRSSSLDASRAPSADRTIVQERVFDAPRELVWKAFTEKAHIDRWWGPNGFRNDTAAMDVRVGGTWRFVMNGPDGKVWPNWIRYEEVVEPERLVYSHGGETDEAEFHVTITFVEHGGRTKLTMTSVFPSAEACALVKRFGAVEGGAQTLARLAGYLPYLEDGTAARCMVITRVFDAPTELVFRAWTTAESLSRWWGPAMFTTPVVELDFRVGGAYRMVMRAPDGSEYPFHGHFLEIVANRRIVFDAVIADGAGNRIVTTATFVEEGEKTRLTVRQDRPELAAAAAGQLEGWNGQLGKLAAMLA